MALLDHEENPERVSALPRATLPRASNTAFPTFPTESPPRRFGNDNQLRVEGGRVAIELDCLRQFLPTHLLQAATSRANRLGIGADRVVIQRGLIDEDSYVQRLGAYLGTPVNRLLDSDGGTPLLDTEALVQAAATGIVQLRLRDELAFAVTPRCQGARGLLQLAAACPALLARIQLTTTADLHRFLTCHAHGTLGRRAADGLRDAAPQFSAALLPVGNDRWSQIRRTIPIAGLAALMLLPVPFAGGICSSLLAASFLGFSGLRLMASMMPRPPIPRRVRRSDTGLPIYTIIVALYREASSVAPLMQAINAIDYPHEKLDVILITEVDDPDTRDAINRLGPMPHLQVLVAPVIGPKTKPKALNYALPFARGSLAAVFDAEDRPEPDQLRAALDAFDHHGDALACAQASLCIDNASESLLAQMFATEYAGQFDAFLPGLATLDLPLPLGGSSNHFRTAILRKVGGWDAYNVTEDADLGVRLARCGYRSTTFASTTFEEAPIRFGAWLRQRSRWMKGWMQTWRVHMRNPRQLWRDAGPRGFLTINLIVGGNVLTALAYPALIAELAALLWSGVADSHWSGFPIDVRMPLHLTAIAAGYLSSIAIGILGLIRRRQMQHCWILLLTPLYWGLLSIAAWRALWQLLRDPYRWEKTEHGVSRRSRDASAIQR